MNRFPPPFRPTRPASAVRRLTVAALVVVPLAACGLIDDETRASFNGDTAAATDASPVPSATSGGPDSESTVDEGPGTGSVFFAGAEDVEATVSLPAGYWTDDVFVRKEDADPIVGLAFYDVGNIYTDPCRWVLLDPPVGPTVDDLVAAFENSPVFDATPGSDVTVDGFPGKYVEVTVPDYDAVSCMKFGLFKEDGPTGEISVVPNFWAQAPHQTLQMWILDVDGTRLVVSAGYHPDTSEPDRQALTDMVTTLDIR